MWFNAFTRHISEKSYYILSSSYVRLTCEINFRKQNRQYIQLQSVIPDRYIDSVHPHTSNYTGICNYYQKYVWDGSLFYCYCGLKHNELLKIVIKSKLKCPSWKRKTVKIVPKSVGKYLWLWRFIYLVERKIIAKVRVRSCSLPSGYFSFCYCSQLSPATTTI